MNTMKFEDLEDGTVRNTIFKLKLELGKKLSGVVNMDTMSISEFSRFHEVTFDLLSQNSVEQFADITEKTLGLSILIAAHRYQKSQYKLIAYTEPVEDKMYSLLLSSEQYGLLDFLCFRVYDSVETMFYDLKNERQNIGKEWTVLEEQPYKDMLIKFIV